MSLGGDDDALFDDADVSIEGGTILVTWWDDRGAVVLAGREVERDRYEIVARSRPRRGILVRDGHRLEGDWTEHDRAGTWIVHLPDEPDE